MLAGSTIAANLALSCFHDNSHKGPNIAGLDPKTRKLTPLFTPRRHKRDRHVRWQAAYIFGRTPVVALDIKHGFLPAVIELLQPLEHKLVLATRREVLEWKPIGSGLWAPVRIKMTNFETDSRYPNLVGEPQNVFLMEVNVEKPHWNRPIGEKAITELPFVEPGTAVFDMQHKRAFVTGKPDRASNLDNLAKHAKNVMAVRGPEVMSGKGFGIAGLLIALMALYFPQLSLNTYNRST